LASGLQYRGAKREEVSLGHLLALVISVAIERRDKVLNAGVLVWTGLLSYSLYLWQQPFLVFDGSLNYLSARILLTFVLAYLSYRSIEQPCSKSVRANDVTNNWRMAPFPPSEIGKTK